MSRSQYLFFVILISVFSMFGCGGGSCVAPTPAPVGVYQVVTVADLHFNPLYDATLYSQLAASDPSQWARIYQGSKVKTPTGGGTDTKRLLPTGDVLEQLPGISPCFGNNPAYKVLTITQDSFTPTDYQSFNYNLAAMPARFGSLYQFSTTYGAQATLGNSLVGLYPQFADSQSKREMYTMLYGSGTTKVSPVTLSA